MRDYFEAVTLGAFSFRDETKTTRFLSLIRGMKYSFILLHLLVVSLALNFPVMLAISRLEPYELYSRLYGENFPGLLPADLAGSAAVENAGENQADQADNIEDFNLLMFRNAWGRRVMLPLLILVFFLVLILQAAFYLMAAFFLGLNRMNSSVISFRERLGFFAFSSTLPALLSALFGLWLPTVHIIVFYFAVIIITFQRSAYAEVAGKRGVL
jgi:hypothetical protein